MLTIELDLAYSLSLIPKSFDATEAHHALNVGLLGSHAKGPLEPKLRRVRR
jgi:hypothetical protein